jgi:hypothetical protein
LPSLVYSQSAIICLNLWRIPGFADALKGAPCGVRLPECLNGRVMAEMSSSISFLCFLLMNCFGLVSFVDEHPFGDLKSFRELALRASPRSLMPLYCRIYCKPQNDNKAN